MERNKYNLPIIKNKIIFDNNFDMIDHFFSTDECIKSYGRYKYGILFGIYLILNKIK